MYVEAQDRLLEIAGDIGEDGGAVPVPALPGWTIKDTYAHLAGVSADVLSGATPADIGDDQWTARHVSERADRRLAQIRAEWAGNAAAMKDHLGARSGLGSALTAVDAWHHEQDIRGALRFPGGRRDAAEVTDVVVAGLSGGWPEDLPAVRIECIDAEARWTVGPGRPGVRLRARVFDVARLLIGRRSRAQALALPWEGPVGTVLEYLHVFPMPTVGLVE
ncbi:uncharacterized protein (TIGR03083 family) [Murinocardiopsis flavida]|uniref:Uncharacterized protein (TIGR03083 family) n=1 Tax=Murinocardiopsis flavida TaxID=645275 RepID=A0A2P8DPA7_9ACTN|nr:uncharacterized protein (TIGR03083 family) [Murinocardiopsis flavida]